MKATLLIISEGASLRRNLVSRLGAQGYVIFEAGREREAKKILGVENIDVVLICLGEFSAEGLPLVKMVRKCKTLSEVIILNSSNQFSLSMQLMKLGVFDDLLYPFDLTLLARRIEEAYESTKKKRQKTVKSLLRRYEAAMVAASFAEAGEDEMAREFLGIEKKQLRDKSNQKIEKGQGIGLNRLTLKVTET